MESIHWEPENMSHSEQVADPHWRLSLLGADFHCVKGSVGLGIVFSFNHLFDVIIKWLYIYIYILSASNFPLKLVLRSHVFYKWSTVFLLFYKIPVRFDYCLDDFIMYILQLLFVLLPD